MQRPRGAAAQQPWRPRGVADYPGTRRPVTCYGEEAACSGFFYPEQRRPLRAGPFVPGTRRPVRAASPNEEGGRWKRPLLRQTTPATTGRRLLYAGGDPAGGREEIGQWRFYGNRFAASMCFTAISNHSLMHRFETRTRTVHEQ